MNYYNVKFNLQSQINQTELMDKLKSSGMEVIQSSDGLYVKGNMNSSEIQTCAGEEKLTIEEIDLAKAQSDENSPTNLKSFLQ